MKVLRRTLLLLLLTLTLNPRPVSAQIPSWLAVSPDNVYKPPGNACYTITVGNGAYMTIDVAVLHPSGYVEARYAWLTLDGNGEANVCVDENTEEGEYVFIAVQNSYYPFSSLLYTWTPLTVNPAPPPPPSRPVLTALGTGCENWDCIWGVGENFNEETIVVVANGPYQEAYFGPALQAWPPLSVSPDGQSFSLQLMDPNLRWLFGGEGVNVLVINSLYWGFVRAPLPEIHSAEPTCPDLYCISFTGSFPQSSRIDFRTRDGADVLQDAYTDLAVTPSQITLRLTPSGRFAYDTEGLRAWAVNVALSNWSGDYYLPPIDRSVIGAIHGIAQVGSEYYLHGWTCAKTHAESIDIQVYAREDSGDVFLFSATANTSTGPEYAAACASTGSHYGFWVRIPPDIRQQHLGRPLFVYGVSPFGLPNAELWSSGAFIMPGSIPLPHRDYIYLGGRVLAADTP